MGTGRALFQNSRFKFDCRMLEAKVQTASPQRIADPPNLVRCQHNERPTPGLDRADLWDRELPVAQDFEEFSLEFLTHFVDLVDQEDTRFLAQKCPQQRSFLEEFERMEVAA
jgi:hypothetical protein